MKNYGSFATWFVERVHTLTSQYQESKTALFFLGLSSYQAKLLAECEIAAPSLATILDDNGCLDYTSLDSLKRETFKLLNSTDGPSALLYEQLGLIKGSLNELYEGKIVIVRNNLFLESEGYPCPGEQCEMESLSSYLMGSSKKEPPSARYYGQVSTVEGHYLVSPIRYEDELQCEVIDLINGVDKVYIGEEIANPISVPGPQYLSARLDVADGKVSNMSFDLGESTIEGLGADGQTLLQLAAILLDSGADCSVIKTNNKVVQQVDGERLIPLLKKYWGEGANFRSLRFYKNPEIDNEMIEISQGAISDYVVSQAELAIRGSENFSNTLMTAPTGAGKSLLFQLAALYLAQKYDVVTIVIEPLKALMNDQVENLKARGVRSVAAINSDISFDERNYELNRVKEGKVSLIYLSPELLLASNIDDILGGRQLGLVVVDEVHTVTSWGKDFRPDYWYLGQYLTKLRKKGMLFPLFCLTATAVFGGKDDIVNQTITDLELGSCKLFLGNPRREDISFSIRTRNKSDFPGRIDEVKFDLAAKWINESVIKKEKSIVYCPYRTHVDSIMDVIDRSDGKVLGYHAGKDKEFREIVVNSFKDGSCRVLVSTKAFGMGIDISDITSIYHFAPTGNLADYIQEIGRAARKDTLRGTAAIDFFHSDSSYARRLYAMSRFNQWQLREIMGKLYSIYASKPRGERSQNILVSPESFSYLFANEKDDLAKANKVKAALMMISQDLKNTYNFPVIVVMPKPTYTTAYICLNTDAEADFLSEFGKYLTKISDAHTRYETVSNQNTVEIKGMGPIYLLKADRMWEEKFSDRTFAQFKHDLFNGVIGSSNGNLAVAARLVLRINYEEDFSVIESRFNAYMKAFRDTLFSLARKGEFNRFEFNKTFGSKLGDAAPAIKNTDALLTAFVKPSGTTQELGRSFKFIFRKTTSDASSATKHSYQSNSKHAVACYNEAIRTLRFLKPSSGKTCVRYLDPKALGSRYELAELLQTLGLATYEVRGGDNPEIFVRLNDPTKIKTLSNDQRYNNSVLKEQNDRHNYSEKVITAFFMATMDSNERWDLVEEYFLGNDDYVANRLGLMETLADGVNGEVFRKVKYRGKKKIFTGLHATVIEEGCGFSQQPYFKIWRSLVNKVETSEEITDLDRLKAETKGARYEYPCLGVELQIESTGEKLHPLLAWTNSRVLLFRQKSAAEYDLAKKTDWTPYLLGQGDSIVKLVDDIITRKRQLSDE